MAKQKVLGRISRRPVTGARAPHPGGHADVVIQARFPIHRPAQKPLLDRIIGGQVQRSGTVGIVHKKTGAALFDGLIDGFGILSGCGQRLLLNHTGSACLQCGYDRLAVQGIGRCDDDEIGVLTAQHLDAIIGLNPIHRRQTLGRVEAHVGHGSRVASGWACNVAAACWLLGCPAPMMAALMVSVMECLLCCGAESRSGVF